MHGLGGCPCGDGRHPAHEGTAARTGSVATVVKQGPRSDETVFRYVVCCVAHIVVRAHSAGTPLVTVYLTVVTCCGLPPGWLRCVACRQWRSGNCVETAALDNGHIAIRNSNHPEAGVVYFTPAEMSAWINGCKAGEFDDLA